MFSLWSLVSKPPNMLLEVSDQLLLLSYGLPRISGRGFQIWVSGSPLNICSFLTINDPACTDWFNLRKLTSPVSQRSPMRSSTQEITLVSNLLPLQDTLFRSEKSVPLTTSSSSSSLKHWRIFSTSSSSSTDDSDVIRVVSSARASQRSLDWELCFPLVVRMLHSRSPQFPALR